MVLRKFLLLSVVLAVFSASIAETLTGRVIGGSNPLTPLGSAKVWLKNNPAVSDSTGADGRFSLSIENTASLPIRGESGGAAGWRIHNNRLDFSLGTQGKIKAELVAVTGRTAAMMYNGRCGKGRQSIPLDPSSAAPGAYILKITGQGGALYEARVAILGNRIFTGNSAVAAQNSKGTTAQLAAPDSLIVLRMGYEIKKTVLANFSSRDLGDIALTPRTYRRDTTVTVKTNRTIEVIVPSDLRELYALPVLYLLHGGGEDHTAWRIKGCLIDTLNKWRGKDSMQAMIIVTPDAASPSNYGYYGKTGDAFYTDLTVDIRKYVESRYKVDTSRYARAISGFSMGAMQTHNLTLFYPNMWGYAYSISGGLYTCATFTEAKMKADITSGVIDTAAINAMRAYKLNSNPTDIAYTNGDTPNFEKFLGTVGIRHTYDFNTYSGGGHTFSYCNAVFRRYAVTIFK